MRRIYILLMHSHTLPSRIVNYVTRYKYSHVAISLNIKCDETYSFGRKSVNNFLDGGFVIERKNGEFYTKFNKTKCKIYEIEVSDKQYNDISLQLKYMKDNNKKYKYDFIGIVPRLFYIPITFKNRYVCSSFIAELLDKNKIVKFEKRSCYVKPSDFEKIESIKEIYSGLYREYMNEI